MPGYWIVKTEPSAYSFDQLERDGSAVWDGVKNAQALIHLRSMAKGDKVLVYHSGAYKALVGLARVERGAYLDPNANDPRLVAVDLVAVRRLARPVTLAAVKSDGRFPDLALVRHGRLSVMPVSATDWKALLKLGGESSS
ncbi:MAG: EVE domain-containing protein [Gemmatimonadales bacterium]|nr:EVE domain-containing protein [Gemmatimonadales bacterium]